MEFVVALLVLAVALAALAIPLYRAHTQPAITPASTLDDLLAQRDGVYMTLRDLDLDHELGKLDDQDYKRQRERYMLQASVILRELDTLRGEGSAAPAGAEIEKQVAAFRKTNLPAPQVAAASAVPPSPKTAPPPPAPRLECPNCKRPYHLGDKFCARCGHSLPQ